MNPKDDLEQRIADHYATEAPSRAPDWLLARTLDTVDTTPQRTGLGGAWTIPPMPPVARLVVQGIAIVTITMIGLTVLRPPSVGPAAPATPPPLTERFDSTLNGISMDYPAGWQTSPATEPWTDGVVTFGDPRVDVIFEPGLREDLYFAVASEALGARTDDEWRADVMAAGGICPGSGGGGGTVAIDGATGWNMACGNRVLIVATDTRGYIIVLHVGDAALADTYSGDWFDAVLDTVDLHPEQPAQANPSPSSPSPTALTPALGAFPAFPAGPLPARTEAALQAVLDAAVEEGAFEGVTASVISADRGSWSGVAGSWDGVPVSPDTRYPTHSAAKTIVAAEILRLAEDGSLALDDLASSHLPPDLSFYDANGATIRQVLGMRSGIPDWNEDSQLLYPAEQAVTAVEVFERLPESQVLPGAELHYASTNYILLGTISS